MSTAQNLARSPEENNSSPGPTELLLERAAEFAARREAAGITQPRPAPPAVGVAVLTCMDARIDVETLFGLSEGDAHILRNAGGVVTDDVERSLAVSQHELGTREIIVLHHTGCGMAAITDESFGRLMMSRTGVRPPWPVHAFEDIEEDVRRSIRMLRESPFLRSSISLRGFIYDVGGGRLTEVTA